MLSLKKTISFPYQLVHWTRKQFYNFGILKRKKLDAYVISIGNVSFGGTGKTPFVIELVKYLASCLEQGARQQNICILMRGYKRKNKSESPIVVDTKDPKTFQDLSVDDIGDEAFMMLEKFKLFSARVLIAVDSSRYRAGQQVLKDFGQTVFVMDDGLQHLDLERNLDVVLVNSKEKGFYREFESVLEKVDYVVHTNVDEGFTISSNTENKKQKYFAMKSSIELNKFPDIAKEYVLLTAIGDPESFYNQVLTYLKEKKLIRQESALRKAFFPDHHLFEKDEVTRVLSLGMNIICSDKDYVKLCQTGLEEHFLVAEKKVTLIPSSIFSSIWKGVADATTSR